jgi:hypothetical protein
MPERKVLECRSAQARFDKLSPGVSDQSKPSPTIKEEASGTRDPARQPGRQHARCRKPCGGAVSRTARAVASAA